MNPIWRGENFVTSEEASSSDALLHLGGGAVVSRWERAVCRRPPALGQAASGLYCMGKGVGEGIAVPLPQEWIR